MPMFLLEGSSHRSCNLASECTHVCQLVWVGLCAFLCVGWYVPPEVRVDCCALCVRVRVHACARQRVLFDRRFRFVLPKTGLRQQKRLRGPRGQNRLPFHAAPLPKTGLRQQAASRPLRPKMTTVPCSAAPQNGSMPSLELTSKSMSGCVLVFRRRAPLPPEPLGYTPARVLRPSRPKVTTLRRKTYGFSSERCYCQNPLEYALATVSRPSRPKVTILPRKIHGSKSARRYRQSPLQYAPSRKIHAKPHGSKSARRYHQSPLEYALATSTQNPRFQKRAPLPQEPSRVRPWQGFAASRPKVTTFPCKTHGSNTTAKRQSCKGEVDYFTFMRTVTELNTKPSALQ